MTGTAYTERQRVWIALSDLFLDTDVTLHFDHIEPVLAESSFSIETLHMILRDEVAPVCLPNLYDIAGEWAGFDTDRLVCRITRFLKRPSWVRRLGQRRRDKALREMVSVWPALQERVIANRAGALRKGNMDD